MGHPSSDAVPGPSCQRRLFKLSIRADRPGAEGAMTDHMPMHYRKPLPHPDPASLAGATDTSTPERGSVSSAGVAPRDSGSRLQLALQLQQQIGNRRTGLVLGLDQGKALEPDMRSVEEQADGSDFAKAQNYTDERAGTLASSQDVRAVGRSIGFSSSEYRPGSFDSDVVLARESATVAQQSPDRAAGVAPSAETLETDADRSDAVGVGALRSNVQAVGTAAPTMPAVQRDRMPWDWIEKAYGVGSPDKTQWLNLLNSAKQAFAKGQTDVATSAYLTLYADVAKLAQATRIVSTSGGINVVTGTKLTSKDAKPGLNFSLADSRGWGDDATATTAYVDDRGNFGVKLNALGTLQPDVAIVLCRSAFLPDKEQTLGILRHEMVHVEDLNQTAVETLLSDPKAKSAPAVSSINTELRAYFEGFMTVFSLTDPAPTSVDHPAFIQFLGALHVANKDIFPWAQAEKSVRSEALARLQDCYCNVFDLGHRKTFDAWVGFKLTAARRDQNIVSPGSRSPEPWDERMGLDSEKAAARIRVKTSQEDFFRSLQGISARKCTGLTLPSAQAGRRRTPS